MDSDNIIVMLNELANLLNELNSEYIRWGWLYTNIPEKGTLKEKISKIEKLIDKLYDESERAIKEIRKEDEDKTRNYNAIKTMEEIEGVSANLLAKIEDLNKRNISANELNTLSKKLKKLDEISELIYIYYSYSPIEMKKILDYIKQGGESLFAAVDMIVNYLEDIKKTLRAEPLSWSYQVHKERIKVISQHIKELSEQLVNIATDIRRPYSARLVASESLSTLYNKIFEVREALKNIRSGDENAVEILKYLEEMELDVSRANDRVALSDRFPRRQKIKDRISETIRQKSPNIVRRAKDFSALVRTIETNWGIQKNFNYVISEIVKTLEKNKETIIRIGDINEEKNFKGMNFTDFLSYVNSYLALFSEFPPKKVDKKMLGKLGSLIDEIIEGLREKREDQGIGIGGVLSKLEHLRDEMEKSIIKIIESQETKSLAQTPAKENPEGDQSGQAPHPEDQSITTSMEARPVEGGEEAEKGVGIVSKLMFWRRNRNSDSSEEKSLSEYISRKERLVEKWKSDIKGLERVKNKWPDKIPQTLDNDIQMLKDQIETFEGKLDKLRKGQDNQNQIMEELDRMEIDINELLDSTIITTKHELRKEGISERQFDWQFYSGSGKLKWVGKHSAKLVGNAGKALGKIPLKLGGKGARAAGRLAEFLLDAANKPLSSMGRNIGEVFGRISTLVFTGVSVYLLLLLKSMFQQYSSGSQALPFGVNGTFVAIYVLVALEVIQFDASIAARRLKYWVEEKTRRPREWMSDVFYNTVSSRIGVGYTGTEAYKERRFSEALRTKEEIKKRLKPRNKKSEEEDEKTDEEEKEESADEGEE